MRTVSALTGLLFCMAFPLAGATAEPAREIEYAYPDQSVWTTRTDAAGEPANPLLKLAGALFAKAGVPWHGKAYPATRMFDNLKDGTSQFAMLVAAPQLKDCCLVGAKPVAVAEIRVWRQAATPPVKSRDDLAGKSVITIRGYSYGGLLGFLNDPGNRIETNVAVRHEAAFAMLEAGRADYLLDYAGPAAEVLAARPNPSLRADLLSRQEVFLVLARSTPDAERVMARLEAAAETLDIPALTGIPTR